MSKTPIDLQEQAKRLYKPPFRFECGYILDAEENVVADNRGLDGPILRMRGWGRISYADNPAALQDSVGALVADILTKGWPK